MAKDRIRTRATDFDARVGAKVSIELQGVGGRFTTEFLGWEKGRFIMLKFPPKQDLFEHVHIEKPLIARYLRPGGEVHGFKTAVQSVIYAPHRILFLNYPAVVEKLNLRKVERANCFLPARIRIEAVQVNGYVLNLSRGGAKLTVVKGEYGLSGKLALNQHVTSVFTVPSVFPESVGEGVEIKVEGLIKKIFQDEERHVFGVEFTSLDPQEGQAVQDYVDEIREYLDSPAESADWNREP